MLADLCAILGIGNAASAFRKSVVPHVGEAGHFSVGRLNQSKFGGGRPNLIFTPIGATSLLNRTKAINAKDTAAWLATDVWPVMTA